MSKSSNYTKALGILDSGTFNGATVRLLAVDGSSNQKHYLTLSEEYGIIHERVYSFVNASNNEAIDVDAGNTAPGSWIGNYTYYHDTPWQRWKVMYVGNGDYEIMDMHSGLLLSIPGSSASQTNAWLYPYDDTDGQKFRFQRNTDGTVTIFSKSSDYKMALGWNGGALAQLPEDNSANQKFNIVLPGYVYNIQNVRSGRSLDSTNSGVTDGTMVTQFTTSPDPQQQWLFCYVANGEYKIINMYNGKLLNIYADSTDENAPACLWYDTGSSGQRFKIIHNGDGSITLLNGATNYQKALCIYSADGGQGLANGDSAVQQTYNSNDNNQKFNIIVESTAMVPEGNYLFKNIGSSLNMAQDNNGGDFCEQHPFLGKFDDQWEVQYLWDGYFRILKINSQKYLTAPESTSNNKKILLEDYDGNSRQLWKFKVIEYGFFEIQSKYHLDNNSNLILSVGSNSTKGANVEQQLKSTAGNCGKWKPVAIDVRDKDGKLQQDIFFLAIPEDDGRDRTSCYTDAFKYLTEKEYDSLNWKYEDINSEDVCIDYIINSKVFISRSHGYYDENCSWITIKDSNLTNLYSTYFVDDNGQVVQNLSNCDLLMFVACHTAHGGNNPNEVNNLITSTVRCGAECAIGFQESILCDMANTWTEIFLKNYVAGISPTESASVAARETKQKHLLSIVYDSYNGIDSYSIAQ